MGLRVVAEGGLKKALVEWQDFLSLWPHDKADQKGWTHQYMQRWRTFCRTCPIISATLLGVVVPLLLIVSNVGWFL